MTNIVGNRGGTPHSKLAATSPLEDRMARLDDGTMLSPVLEFTLISIATSQPSLADLALAALGINALPVPGKAGVANDGWLLGLSNEQWMLFSEKLDIKLPVAPNVYQTDQSDGWVAVRLEGPSTQRTLRLLTMIDTDPLAFEVGDFGRTTIEHLNAIVWRKSNTEFILLSASSSAESFWHALENALVSQPRSNT